MFKFIFRKVTYIFEMKNKYGQSGTDSHLSSMQLGPYFSES